MPTLDTIVSLLSHYGYFLLFPIAVIEGPIITVIAGLLVSQGYMDFYIAYSVVVVGDVVGDLMYYGLGRWSKKAVLERWGKYVGIRPEHIDSMDKYLNTNPGKSILFGKWTHSAGFFILLGSGASKVPVKTFLWYNFLGTLPKSLGLLLLGYFLGSEYNKINSDIGKVSFALFVLLAIGFGGYYILKKMKTAK